MFEILTLFGAGLGLGALFFWLVLSIVAGVIGEAKGRFGLGYFLVSIFLTPLVGLVLVACLPNLRKAREVKESAEIDDFIPAESIAKGTHRRCPDCAEFILKEARKCKHCGSAVTPLTETTSKDGEPAVIRRGRLS